MLWYLYYDGGPDDKETNEPLDGESFGGEFMRSLDTTDAAEAIRKISTELFHHLAKPKDSSFVVTLFRIPEKALCFEMFYGGKDEKMDWNTLFNVSRDAFQACADQTTYWNMGTGESHFDITEEPTQLQVTTKALYRYTETKDADIISKAKISAIEALQKTIDVLKGADMEDNVWALYQSQTGMANDTEVKISQVRSQILVKEKRSSK